MTMQHHPSDETLLRYAAGTLEAGPALVVAAHLEFCADCREQVRTFEAVGGAMLEGLPPAEMSTDALERTLALLDGGKHAASVTAAVRQDRVMAGDIALPAALRGCRIGPWRWRGPGVRISRVVIPAAPDAHVMLIKVGAGRHLPHHGHSGTEFTLVLKGAFSDASGRYARGDLAEADAQVEHEPVVDQDGECICLAALEGQMRFQGLLGRIVQPFVGI